jgi:chemotaxis protein MotB
MPNELSAVGYGEFHPISDNSTIEGKQKNRRVDIVILNSQTGQQETNAYSSPKPEKELNP